MSARIGDREIRKIIAFVRARLTRGHPGAREEQIDDAIADELERWLQAAPEDVQGDVEKSSKWIFLRARNLLWKAMKRDRRTAPIDPESDYDGRISHSPTDAIEIHQDLEPFLRKLAEHSYPQHVTVVYYDLYEYPIQNIADILGCSITAAWKHHSRALKFLQNLAKGNSPNTRKKRT